MYKSRVLQHFLAGYFVLHILVASIFLVVVTRWLRAQMIDQQAQRLHAMAVVLREHIEQLEDGLGDPQLLTHIEQLAKHTGARFTLITADGKVIADSETARREIGFHGDRPEVLMAAEQGVGVNTRHSATLNIWMMYLAVRVPGEPSDGRLEITTIGRPQRQLRLRATPLPDQPHHGLAVVLQDVTELRRLETMWCWSGRSTFTFARCEESSLPSAR